jgi:hypothetical protein
MKAASKTIPCGGCGGPVYWKLLKSYHKENEGILIKNQKPLYYSYACPRCKAVTEYYPDFIRDTWLEENPGIGVQSL